MEQERPVVELRGVQFSYGKGKNAETILQNVNMTVPRGKIYALLGPSGCGKTTILRLITGRISSKNRGDIFVFGKRPLSKSSLIPGPGIGYMPQDLALHAEMTIMETLTFFGRLNGLKTYKLQDKIEAICKVLHLNLREKRVEHLSGGQQRRVSLATALLHCPPLLILDEPTVGVDPLLRKNIWSYLIQLARTKNISVIITTHYIEEAKGADIIGPMRLGRVLVEASPSAIMDHFKGETLEACFAKLCYMDNSQQEINLITQNTTRPNTEVNKTLDFNGAAIKHIDDEINPLSSPMLATPGFFTKNQIMCKRNFLLQKRNVEIILFQMIIPLSQVVLFCICIGHELSNLPLAIVNEERNSGWGETFVNNLDKSITTTHFSTFDDGLESVKAGKHWGVLHLQENFTHCFKRKLELGLDSDIGIVNCSTITGSFDTTNNAIYNVFFRTFIFSFQSFMQEILTSMGKSPLIARWPIDMAEPIYGESNFIVFGEYVIPGLIVLIAHFLSAGVTGVLIIYEKRNGMEEKLWVSAVNKVDLLFSHFITQMAIVLVQNIMVLITAYLIFQQPFHGNVFIFLALVLGQSLTGMAFGLFISSYISNERGAVFLFIGAMFTNLTGGAIYWPRESQSTVVRIIFNFLPVTMPTEAIRAIASKGWGLEHMLVIWGFVSTAGWGVFFFAGAYLKLKYFP